MKVHELLGTKLLLESIYLDATVKTLQDLKDPKTGKYYKEEVNVRDDVLLKAGNLSKLPVTFGKVLGSFYINDLGLTSLEGSPKEVGLSFVCSQNELTSLKGAPRIVRGGFYCSGNKITSLEGAPSEIYGNFYCTSNQISSLEGVHKIIKKISGSIDISTNPIKTGGIGLLLIEGLDDIHSNQKPFKIIGKYLGQGKKGLLFCQEELVEAGLEEFAKL